MPLDAGQVIGGRYTLIGKLGSGGMADVWLASDDMLGRKVALKFLHERFAQDQQFVERFRREAQAAAGLQHPNVVGVYDRGDTDGRHWIAMEYVEGAMLKDLIARGLTVGEAVEIIRQVLAGAKFAHARGIVHRDLKPQNVMVDNDGRARVTDFGIARAGVSEITATGSVLGTAQYLSPEQAQGLDVTPASDIYSVGVMLYESLTGRVPFDADSPVAVALKQVSEQPRAPSELNPAVPPALDAIVLRALAKEPQNRFADADEFLRALEIAEADPSGGSLGDTAQWGALAGAAAAGAAGAVAGAALGADTAQPGTGEQPLLTEEEPKKKLITRNRAIVLAVLALIGAGVAAWALTRPEKVNVPSVIGEQVSVATTALEDRGFDVSESPVPNCAPDGTVTEQDPPAGTEVDDGSEVTLTVSEGFTVTVPPVRDETEADAKKILEDENLLVESRKQASKEIDEGRVIETDPAAGSEVECDAVVTMVVSKGQNLVSLDDFTGLSQATAESAIRRQGLIPDIDPQDADEPEGTVIGQDPGPGSELARGDTVTLIVSNGAGTVIVPNVIGKPEETAVPDLTGRGLDVEIVRQDVTNPSEDGRVLDQAPPSGTRLRIGDDVTIFIGELVEEEDPTTTTTDETTVPQPDTPINPRAHRRKGSR